MDANIQIMMTCNKQMHASAFHKIVDIMKMFNQTCPIVKGYIASTKVCTRYEQVIQHLHTRTKHHFKTKTQKMRMGTKEFHGKTTNGS